MTTTLTRPTAPPSLNGHHTSSPPRAVGRRNHARIALGLVVLVLCVLAAMTIYGRASDRIEVFAVRQPVAAGQHLTAADIETVSVSTDAEARTIPATSRDAIVGQTAAVGLVAGSLLSPGQLSDGPRVPTGMALIGATLKPGQYPIGLRPGDLVALVETPVASATSASADAVTRGQARVLEVESPSDPGSAIAVSLIVPTADAAPIATAGAAGRLNVMVVGVR